MAAQLNKKSVCKKRISSRSLPKFTPLFYKQELLHFYKNVQVRKLLSY
ncbi:hypothetical protein CSB68_2627 [Acinetobacter baumannii]|nr:hypothetical protein CSB68_2627 [Acinetobacter baumannii]